LAHTENWKLLMSTSDESEANLTRSRLEAEGIQCKMQVVSSFPGEKQHGGRRDIRIFVRLESFELSQQVLEENTEEDGAY